MGIEFVCHRESVKIPSGEGSKFGSVEKGRLEEDRIPLCLQFQLGSIRSLQFYCQA
jgi:hypothetical protein